MQTFKKYIQKYTFLKKEEWQEIEKSLERKTIPKKTILLEEGKVCKDLYFLENGLLRFFIWRDGEAISKFFTIAPYCFTSQRSFTSQKPTKENIEALEDSVIWQMKREDAYELFKFESWSNFIRELTQEVQYNTEVILEEIQNQTAEERYSKMLEEKSILLERVPLKYLASYLGIAPQSLSRIRKKILEKSRT